MEGDGFGEFGVGGEDAVDSTVFFIAKVGDVCIAATVFEATGCGVVLDNEVVPVDEPEGAIGADLGHDGGGPFVIGGDDVEGVGGFEV